MNKTLVFSLSTIVLLSSCAMFARGKKSQKGYTHLASGLDVKVVRHGTGTLHAGAGDHIEMHIRVHIKDSTMFDSRKMNDNKPVPYTLQAPSFKGDPIEGFMMLVAGDSAHMRLPVDTLLKQNKQMMPGMKAGDILEYEVVLVSAMTDAEYKKDQAEKSAKQKIRDEHDLDAYFKQHNITAERTPSGLYYSIAKEGTGKNADSGQTVSVNYTGRLMNGKTFDSNTDPEFKHVEPYTFPLGKGSVIKGWDEGLTHLKKGTKATLYIPSALAYGSQDRSPTIPANSILVFDVEIVDIADK